jgi:hypothetical protein
MQNWFYCILPILFLTVLCRDRTVSYLYLSWQYSVLTALCSDHTVFDNTALIWPYCVLILLYITRIFPDSIVSWSYCFLTVCVLIKLSAVLYLICICPDHTLSWQYSVLTALCSDCTVSWQYYIDLTILYPDFTVYYPYFSWQYCVLTILFLDSMCPDQTVNRTVSYIYLSSLYSVLTVLCPYSSLLSILYLTILHWFDHTVSRFYCILPVFFLTVLCLDHTVSWQYVFWLNCWPYFILSVFVLTVLCLDSTLSLLHCVLTVLYLENSTLIWPYCILILLCTTRIFPDRIVCWPYRFLTVRVQIKLSTVLYLMFICPHCTLSWQYSVLNALCSDRNVSWQHCIDLTLLYSDFTVYYPYFFWQYCVLTIQFLDSMCSDQTVDRTLSYLYLSWLYSVLTVLCPHCTVFWLYCILKILHGFDYTVSWFYCILLVFFLKVLCLDHTVSWQYVFWSNYQPYFILSVFALTVLCLDSILSLPHCVLIVLYLDNTALIWPYCALILLYITHIFPDSIVSWPYSFLTVCVLIKLSAVLYLICICPDRTLSWQYSVLTAPCSDCTVSWQYCIDLTLLYSDFTVYYPYFSWHYCVLTLHFLDSMCSDQTVDYTLCYLYLSWPYSILTVFCPYRTVFW